MTCILAYGYNLSKWKTRVRTEVKGHFHQHSEFGATPWTMLSIVSKEIQDTLEADLYEWGQPCQHGETLFQITKTNNNFKENLSYSSISGYLCTANSYLNKATSNNFFGGGVGGSFSLYSPSCSRTHLYTSMALNSQIHICWYKRKAELVLKNQVLN